MELGTAGISAFGSRVTYEESDGNVLRFSTTGAGRVIEQNTFEAEITTGRGEKTRLRISLDSYKLTQSKLFYFIPIGPKVVLGFAAYKRYLDQVAQALRSSDGSAQVTISTG